MPSLTPVDFDPFAASEAPPPFVQGDMAAAGGSPLRVTVSPMSAEQPKFTPVDHDPFAQPMGMGEDIGRSLVSGIGQGLVGIAALPAEVSELGARGINAAVQAVGKYTGRDVGPSRTPVDRPPGGFEDIKTGIETGLNDKFYEPQTTPGKYAKTVGEFAPGIVGGGSSIPQVVARGIKFVAGPGVASEAAGQATKGTAAEPWVRAATAVAAPVLLHQAPGLSANRVDRAVRNALPEGVTQPMVDQAQTLIQNAGHQGVTLSWPEALSQVAGRPVLTDTLRQLEAAPPTAARMAEFFGQRPAQVEAAGRDAMQGIAPVNNAPATIGPAAGRTAEGVVNDVRDTINRATEPFYNAASTHRLTPQEMARARALPGFEEARDAVRNDPQLNRYVAHLPDDSVGFLNEVKKYFDQQAQNAARPMAQNPNMQRAAGYGRDATDTRQLAIDASGRNAGLGNPNPYEVALNVQEQTRRQFLEPLLQGPLGKLADRDKSTRDAINALFPKNPLPNSADEISTAVGAMANRSPRIAADLVRAHVESVFNEATRSLQTGANPAGGAKFRVALVGNAQQQANFEAAVRALPNGAERLAGFNRFLDVVEATGTRQNIGSKTAYNAQFLQEIGQSGLVGETAKGFTNPVGRGAQFLADKYQQWLQGRNLNALAEILTNPGSANHLRAIARMPAGSRQAQQIAVRLLAQIEASTIPVDKPNQQPRNQ